MHRSLFKVSARVHEHSRAPQGRQCVDETSLNYVKKQARSVQEGCPVGFKRRASRVTLRNLLFNDVVTRPSRTDSIIPYFLAG